MNKNPLTKKEKKQINTLMSNWWKMQEMESTHVSTNNKKFIKTKKLLKTNAKKVDNIIKKYKKTKK